MVLLSRNEAYRIRTLVTVAPVTRTIRHLPVEVLLDAADGMPARCVVNLDDILTISKTRLDRSINTYLQRSSLRYSGPSSTLSTSNRRNEYQERLVPW